MQIDKSNTQLRLTVSDLRLKVKARNKEVHKEMQKVSTQRTPVFYPAATEYEHSTQTVCRTFPALKHFD